MLRVVKENHIAIFDARSQYITSFTFQIAIPDSKKDKDESKQPQLENQYEFTLNVDKEFQYTWNSDFFDLDLIKNEAIEFGSIPFSLDTFLEMYKDPKVWKFIIRPKSDDYGVQDVVNKTVGKLVIKTSFTKNPFILPVQSRSIHFQCQKIIKVIAEANQQEQVFCSAEEVSKDILDEVDVWIPEEDENCPQEYFVYSFQASERVSPENICIIKGIFNETTVVHKERVIKILSSGKEVRFIPNLEKVMKMLKYIDNNIFIFQNVETTIEDAYRFVFFTNNASLYEKIFRSYLYTKIFDKWVIEGIVNYSRDNRHFQDCMQELVDLMTDGEELFPLSNSDYSFDQVWKVKAKFIYHILVNVSGSNLTEWILEFSKKQKMTSPQIFSKIKNKFGKSAIKKLYENPFINSTGMTRVFYEMEHIKKDHKIRLTLRQKSLQCALFRRYNYIRIKLEEGYRLVSPMMEKIIKKNEGKKNQMTGPLAVPEFLKCLPYFKGSLSLQIEGMEPFEEELLEQNITQRFFDFKPSLRTRRVMTSRKEQQEVTDEGSWMMLDAGLVFPAVYKGQNLSEKLILSLVQRSYESEIEELKVLNSISIKEHSKSTSICRELIEKLKIKPANENSKISVKRKIFQLLPNFMTNCRDLNLWDELLKLLQLYEPVCFDYSEEGNLFLLSLLDSIGKINYDISFSSYFEEFHRIMLAISRFHQCITEEKFESIHRQIFISLMKWPSKYSLEILQEACDFLELTFTHPLACLSIIKIIVENVLPYINVLRLKKQNFKVVRDIHQRIQDHIKLDKTGTIRSVFFENNLKESQKALRPMEFLVKTFSELEEIEEEHAESLHLCLSKFKDVISKNRDRYALDIQLTIFNENQNYFLAEYLWKQMCGSLSVHDPRVRLAWMKIYRVFYFYFTPIITMYKMDKNLSTREFDLQENQTIELLENIMDFVPDIRWFSVYDSSSNKKKKNEGHSDFGRRKRKEAEDYKFEFDNRNFFTDFIAENPGKDSWEDLSKETLNYLKREYENKESGYEKNNNQKQAIDSTTQEKYKRIVQKLKGFITLLKRGNTPDNFDYSKLKRKVLTLLHEAGENISLANELFQLQDQTLDSIKELKEKRESEKNGDLKISLGNLMKSEF